MIIIDELPFRFIEGYEFQRYSTTLQPKLRIRDIPSRQTMARDVIHIYGVEREKLREALKGRKAEKSIGCSNKIEKYLAEICESRRDVKFEILGWLKANSNRYQVLSKMARDVLAIPVSIIASKSAFSTEGRILDPFRSSLSLLMVQNLVCAQNWLQAHVPVSFHKSKDEVEALEDEFHDLGLICVQIDFSMPEFS
ncbi:hypothetical protein SO802_003338 [Lithocarpus litseifolius]|uniref:HAT C-terminal dimerisation domain-containing protein n=1 Tax=Lithocarpus litseifolius TaxID=425828 RepID=A0AAW2E3L3_9ROSI